MMMMMMMMNTNFILVYKILNKIKSTTAGDF